MNVLEHRHALIQKFAADLLLTKGASIDARDENGDTPLVIAVSFLETRAPLIQLLISKGANINCVNGEGDTPLNIAVSQLRVFLFESALNIVNLFANHPDIDWSLSGNSDKPIATLRGRITAAKEHKEQVFYEVALGILEIALLKAEVSKLSHQLEQINRKNLERDISPSIPQGPEAKPS